MGFRTAMKVLDNSRLDVAATSLGIAEAALACAADWARQRQVGGEPLARKQGLQWMFADMRTRLERLAADPAGGGAAPGRRALHRAGIDGQALCLRDGRVCHRRRAADPRRLRLHARMPLERLVRDARILRIYEGSSEIQRTVIARAVLA